MVRQAHHENMTMCHPEPVEGSRGRGVKYNKEKQILESLNPESLLLTFPLITDLLQFSFWQNLCKKGEREKVNN